MKDTKDTKPVRPTLQQIENELKGMFGGVAIMMNECFYPESGFSLLALSSDANAWGVMDKIDLYKTNIGRLLPIYYAYAYEGRLTPGYEGEILNGGNNLEKLSDFVYLLPSNNPYFELCLDVAGLDVTTDTGHLVSMLDRVSARSSLDNGSDLTVSEVAILAEMGERSVKNALTAEGENRLNLNEQGVVDNAEAQRWLKGRRGFTPTTRTSFPEDVAECPEQLDALEIPSFVIQRIGLRFGESTLEKVLLTTAGSPDYDNCFAHYPSIASAAEAAKLPPSVIQAAMQQPLKIQPEHCQGLARALGVDPVWFTLQVMRALFPTQIDMLLNPGHYVQEAGVPTIEGNSVDIVLTEAMIKHGYLDLPSYAKALFPTDCFGTRKTEDEGAQVCLKYGGQEVMTDIRIKSEQTISPRKRFSAWLQKELSARSGDRIRFTRVTERTFELTHFPK